MKNNLVKLGYDAQYRTPIFANFSDTGHLCCIGGTGSGKSMAVLYFLYNLLKTVENVELWIGDFKKSGDYKGLSKNFSEFDKVTNLIEDFYKVFEGTPENSNEIKFLLIEEYAGYITWLAQADKKKCEEIKGKISNLLMLGRSKHTYVWCIQQRMSASLFPSGIGAIDNYQICVGLSRLNFESRKTLFAGEHFEDEAFEKTYAPGQGQGLILIDGQPLRPLVIPRISSKEELKDLLRKYANRK
ncbi:hypothetical protein [Lacrimispora sp.]|uniref:hypothetical protein n=1 Tax=Lacrimispora sp. TaxID=2719234 RepID=UPI0028B180A7|nr:hypothetical protein [Lacrimispora sp.]